MLVDDPNRKPKIVSKSGHGCAGRSEPAFAFTRSRPKDRPINTPGPKYDVVTGVGKQVVSDKATAPAVRSDVCLPLALAWFTSVLPNLDCSGFVWQCKTAPRIQ
jgi:hypothetical protein